MINNAQLLADEAKYCSFGDTVHYVNPPKIFSGCEGSYMYDEAGTPYLDLQMWYSAVNFGYKNKRLEQKMIEQLQTLPQAPRCSTWPPATAMPHWPLPAASAMSPRPTM